VRRQGTAFPLGSNRGEDVREPFDPTMAVREEPKRLVEGVVGSSTERKEHATMVARAGHSSLSPALRRTIVGTPFGTAIAPGLTQDVMQTFSAHVSRIRTLTHDVREIELTLRDPGEIHFAPGQFVSFEIERAGFRVPATRPYSIASSPSGRHAVQLVLNHVPGGPGSEYLFGLREGDVTTFRGPVGSFTLRDGQRDLLFVATGTGIAPIRSMLWSLADASSLRVVTLYWGLRSERDLYYQDELARLGERMPHFSFVTTLSRPVGAWHGAVGRVSPLVESQIPGVSNLEAFLCGNAAMIRDVRDILRKKGLCPIHMEQYYDDRASTGSESQ